MSWQNYVDQQLIGTGEASGGIIAGHDGNIWATSPEFSGKVTPQEIATIFKAFDDPSSAYVNGLRLAGEKWRCVRVDDGWIHLKKDQGSAHCVRTQKTVLIAANDGTTDSMTEGKTNNCVHKLGDYLKNAGY